MSDDLVPSASPTAPDGFEAMVVGLRRDERLEALVAGWLLGFASPHTRAAYGRDLRAWLEFCDSVRISPLGARQAHVDAWARILEADGAVAGDGGPSALGRFELVLVAHRRRGHRELTAGARAATPSE